MEKIFEDYFAKFQADMVSICLDYVEKRADVVYIYCVSEKNVLTSGFFYKINNKLVMKSRLNDAIAEGQREYDVSIPRQKKAVDAINEGIAKLRDVCQKCNRDMPTQIKITYDVVNNKLKTECSYELFFTNHRSKTAYDILQKWFDEEKNKKC